MSVILALPFFVILNAVTAIHVAIAKRTISLPCHSQSQESNYRLIPFLYEVALLACHSDALRKWKEESPYRLCSYRIGIR